MIEWVLNMIQNKKVITTIKWHTIKWMDKKLYLPRLRPEQKRYYTQYLGCLRKIDLVANKKTSSDIMRNETSMLRNYD